MRLWQLLCICALALPGCSSPASPPRAPAPPDAPGVTVSGQAEIQVVPDRVMIECAVVTHDRDVAKARQVNQGAVQRVLAAARGLGLKEEDLQVATLDLRERTDDKDRFLDYTATTELSVQCTDLSRVDALLTALIQAGVNRVDEVSLRCQDMARFRAEARTMAMKAAREKADTMARALGQSAGRAVMIRELGVDDDELRRYTSNFIQIAPDPEPEEGGLAAGRIPVQARVEVTFELR